MNKHMTQALPLPRLALMKVGPPPPLLTLLVIASLHGAFLLWAGQAMSPDSYTYAKFSRRLVDSGFDFAAVIAETTSAFPPLLYGLFVTVLALLRVVFGNGWLAAFFMLNFAAHMALGLLVVQIAARITSSGFAAWGALILFLGCHDLFRWVRFVLSDTTFVLIAFFIFTLAAARILGDAKGWLRVAAPAVAGVFYRPTGMVLLPDLAWAAYLASGRRVKVPKTLFGLAIGSGAAAAAILFVWLVQDPTRWPFDSLSTPFRVVGDGYAVGEVVSARYETYHAPPTGIPEHLLIVADRFVHFFAIGAQGYSTAHWLAALTFYLPTYGLAAWLGISLWRGDHGFGEPQRRVFLAAAGAVLAYALFHAFVQVDFDWRYRAPVLPHLILLASGGAADLLRRAVRK